MAQITLGGRKKAIKYLTVKIGDESYNVPLAGALRVKELSAMNTVEKTAKFLKKYIPAEIMDDLTMDEYNELVNAWNKASQEAAGGVTVGES